MKSQISKLLLFVACVIIDAVAAARRVLRWLWFRMLVKLAFAAPRVYGRLMTGTPASAVACAILDGRVVTLPIHACYAVSEDCDCETVSQMLGSRGQLTLVCVRDKTPMFAKVDLRTSTDVIGGEPLPFSSMDIDELPMYTFRDALTGD